MMAADLFDALGVIPALPGARCRGRHHLFDGPAPGEDEQAVRDRHAQALGLCVGCPAAARCREWFDTLPPRKRPAGVIAGTVVR
ncbi:hypothetical protein BN971_03242 [Mycobacterium bohemicum DSM 44277]|uniref:4Fe-4S Wbl-type domain-containing protein n=1 Tax=Mycobacterium bohemicum DSM 44277 TaxID=1236609 RepID=A0A0U0WCP4_MYCBE|nr:hypothetical protein [Mycobacterium bohemicum]MCV6968179.1 hypothetical protein [Mycobacterium bohemicum]CPR11949.1 hypothetical protein BN971_03242 [Mycobacterium bohemicum DSM 44277]